MQWVSTKEVRISSDNELSYLCNPVQYDTVAVFFGTSQWWFPPGGGDGHGGGGGEVICTTDVGCYTSGPLRDALHIQLFCPRWVLTKLECGRGLGFRVQKPAPSWCKHHAGLASIICQRRHQTFTQHPNIRPYEPRPKNADWGNGCLPCDLGALLKPRPTM